MKNTDCFLLILISCMSLSAQQEITWTIFHDKTKLFSSSIENEEQNNLVVNIADLKSGKNFIISYSDAAAADKKGQWKRTIGIYNSVDKELCRTDSEIVRIPDAQLKKMLQENKTIRVYTWSLPKDSKEAARVRIRRVHLCTIMLKQ
jgi:hypothetical protein